MRRISSFSSFCFVLPALIVFLALPGQAEARPDMASQNSGDRFSAMDTDKNGSVSREEFFAAHPQMKDAAFDAIDSDKNGEISAQEWDAFFGSHSKDAAAAHPAEGHDEKVQDAEKKPAKAPDLIMPPKSGN